MPNLKNKAILLTLILPLIILLGYYVVSNFFSTFALYDSSAIYPRDLAEYKLLPGRPITEKFIATRNGLKAVKVAIKSFPAMKGDSLRLDIADESCNTILASTTITGSESRVPGYFIFLLDHPLVNTQSKTFCAEFTLSVNEFRTKHLPELYASSSLASQGMVITDSGSNQTIIDQSLVMRPGYTNGSLRTDLKELSDRISQNKPWFLKSTWLYWIFGGCLLSSFALVLVLVLRTKD